MPDTIDTSGIAVIGGSGFVGRALTAHLAEAEIPTTVVSRTRPKELPPTGVCFRGVASYDDDDVRAALNGTKIAIYLAARAHLQYDRSNDPLNEFRLSNRDTPLAFLEQAAKAKLRRLIFVSTIGVNGAVTFDRPFHATDMVYPHSAYAQSKWEAEVALRKRCSILGIELVIIRPPLVYGCNAPGNFARLIRLVKSGVPLPFGSIKNKRSLLGIDNLCDLLRVVALHPAAPGHVLLAADGSDLSTSELIRALREAAGLQAKLLPFPMKLLRRVMLFAGSPAMATQLLGSLQVDTSATQNLLQWRPPVTVSMGLRRCFGEAW